VGLLAWIVFGAIAGWLASIVAGTSRQQGCLTDIIVGIVGAFVGGLIMQFVTGHGFAFGFNVPSFVVAGLGAIVLLVITGATRRGRRRR